MADYYKKLVELYAEHDVDDIRKNSKLIEKKFGRSQTDLTNDWDFPAQKRLVQEIKRKIEKRRDRLVAPTQKQRIAECLNIVLQVATFGEDGNSERQKKLKVIVSLLEQMFSDNWSKAQIAHFEFAADLVHEWKSYFVSYTNSQPQALNERYKKVIKYFVNQSILNDRDWNDDNILVDAIVKILENENLKGYYDREQIVIGDNIKENIPPAAMHSFSFIQLVQPETFTEKSPNWSYDEFKYFLKHNHAVVKDHELYRGVFRKRFKSVLTHDNQATLVPAFIPFEYEAWRDRIFDIQHHKILPTDPEKFFLTIKTLSSQIFAHQREFFESVPD